MQKVRVLATACSIAKPMAGERPQCYCLFPSSVVNVLGMCGPGPALQESRLRRTSLVSLNIERLLFFFFLLAQPTLPGPCVDQSRPDHARAKLHSNPLGPVAMREYWSLAACFCTSGGFDPRALLCGRCSKA